MDPEDFLYDKYYREGSSLFRLCSISSDATIAGFDLDLTSNQPGLVCRESFGRDWPHGQGETCCKRRHNKAAPRDGRL
jgi:hypothetical protein